MRMRILAVSGLLAVSGCTNSVDGQAVEAHFWDPCTELSDEALRAAGANPETKRQSNFWKRWKICDWDIDPAPYYLSIFSTAYTMAYTRANNDYIDRREIALRGRPALLFNLASIPQGMCTVAFATAYGSLHVEVARPDDKGDACPLAVEKAEALAPYLPM